MRLRSVQRLLNDRDIAMKRARHCRNNGFPGVAIDVQIARRSNRLAIRILKRGV